MVKHYATASILSPFTCSVLNFMIAETLPQRVAVLPVPLSLLAGTVAAYALMQYRYQPERAASVLPQMNRTMRI